MHGNDGRLMGLALALLALTACSSGGAPSAQAPPDPPAGQSPSSPDRTSAPQQGTESADADAASADDSGSLPNGTLTWQVVYTGRLSEANVNGPEADIARSRIDEHWVTRGRAKLTGLAATGALAPNGDDQKAPAGPSGSDMSAAALAERAAKKCGGDQGCMMAAMMKLSQNASAMNELKARGDAISATVGRLATWKSIAAMGDACHLATAGTQTADWSGRARFTDFDMGSGATTVAYSTHASSKGTHEFDCAPGRVSPDIELRADKVTKVYDLTLPAVQVDTAGSQQSTTSGGPKPNPLETSGTIELPSVVLKGIPFPMPLQALHGERTLHDIGSVPAARRSVHLQYGKGMMVSNNYAAARDRPAIPLDAEVTWTFTPDHG